jgi:hypothetical protein
MNNIQLNISNKIERNEEESGYQIIEINVTDPSENTFAVVTPVKMK